MPKGKSNDETVLSHSLAVTCTVGIQVAPFLKVLAKNYCVHVKSCEVK